MAINPIALQVDTPQIDGVGQFAAGAEAGMRFDAAKKEQARKGLETIASIAIGSMGGKLDGQVNPEHFEQGLAMLEQQGINVDQFRGHPELAPVVARASLDTMEQLRLAADERDYDLRLREFGQRVSQAAKQAAASSSAAEQKVSRLMETGLDRNTAIGIADGRFRLATDETGRQQVIDVSTGAPVQQAQAGSAPPTGALGDMSQAPADGPFLAGRGEQNYSIIPEGTDIEQTLSIGGVLRGTANTISDFFTGNAGFEEQEQAASALNSLRTQSLFTLQEPVAGRPSVFTMQRINDLIITPSMGRSQAASRAQQMVNMIEPEMRRVKNQIIDDPQSWKPEQVRTAQQNYNQMQALLDSYRDISNSLSRSGSDRPSLESFERPY